MRLITRLAAFYHRPKIIRLNLLAKTEIKEGGVEEEKGRTLTEHLKMEKRKVDEEISLRTLKQTMNLQNDGLSKQENTINRLIKVETKSSSLFKLYKSKHLTFTPKNLINLLIKVLQLRYINPKEAEDTQSLYFLLGVVSRKMSKLSPEDMIRFLHSLKKVSILPADFLKLRALIGQILDEFSSRTDETAMKRQNEYESFYVITIDANIKLLHCLHHLYTITGNQFEPIIVNLIKGSLAYFHRLNVSKEKTIHSIKDVNWSFFISFVKLSHQYQMPFEVTSAFIRSLNMHKKSYQGNYNYLFSIQQTIHDLTSALPESRGENITKHQHLFHIHLFIYQLIEKPNELIKMKPLHLITHIKCLNNFTQSEIEALKYQNIRTTTLERILLFTTRVYEKYFTANYASDTEKTNIERWVSEGSKQPKQYLGPLLRIYKELLNKKIVKNSSQFNKLFSLCSQNLESLSQHSQMTILLFTLQQSSANSKPLIDSYFGRGEKDNSKVRKFKKGIEIDAYSQLFSYWSKMNQITNIPIDQYSQNCFLKVFFTRIVYLQNLQNYAVQFTNRILGQKSYLSFLIKKYIKVSESNRFLGKSAFEKSQSPEFKKQLEQQTGVLVSQRADMSKLNEFAQLKFTIRSNMKRGLTMFKFFILLLENMNKSIGSGQANITESTLFKELYFHFNEEIKCLFFKEIFTIQIYNLAEEIHDYLNSKGSLDENSQLFKIHQHQTTTKIQTSIDRTLGLYQFNK